MDCDICHIPFVFPIKPQIHSLSRDTRAFPTKLGGTAGSGRLLESAWWFYNNSINFPM